MDKTNDSGTCVKISLPWTWRPVKRRMLPGCELFRDGDVASQVARKLIPLEDEDDLDTDIHHGAKKETFPCSASQCTQTFTSLLSFENHYKSAHCHVCSCCRRTLPSAFLLDLHIQENHDPLFDILASKQPMYRCLVESCGDKFSAPDPRRQHMIKKHSYPANFRFHRLKPTRKQPDTESRDETLMEHQSASIDPTHNASSYTSSTHKTTAFERKPSLPSDADTPGLGVEEGVGGKGEEERMDVAEAEKVAPRRVFVHKVPAHLTFGHGVSRGFQRPPGQKKMANKKKKGGHWHQQAADDGSGDTTTTTNIENVDMKDMADALSDTV